MRLLVLCYDSNLAFCEVGGARRGQNNIKCSFLCTCDAITNERYIRVYLII